MQMLEDFPVYVTKEVIDSQKTAEKARIAREKLNLSLREVARRMAISAAYLSDLERGNRSWSQDVCDWFEDALSGKSR